jgi:hypothetical protein
MPERPERKAWFLVMGPADANRPGSQWVRLGAASQGKLVVRPISGEGWIALAAFVVLLVAGPLAIWTWLFLAGSLSVATAIAATVVLIAAVVSALILLVRARMTRLPPA